MPVLISYSSLTPTPWVNGRGETTELVSWDRSRTLSAAGVPDWRLSIARLAAPAPFSPIPGVRRTFLPVGTQVSLTVNGVPRRVASRTVSRFAGDDDVHLIDLASAPGHAVNLMVRTADETAGPALVVGRTDGELFATCLVAVALESAGDVAAFDVLAPGSAWLAEHPIAVAMVVLAVPPSAG